MATDKMGSPNNSPFYKLLPKFVRTSLEENKLKRTIFNYYDKLPQNIEEKEAIEYLKKNRLRVFPYAFQYDYERGDIKVFDDNKLGLKYILFEGKRLYFRRGATAKGIQRDYNYLRIEQDIRSPHRYLTDYFTLLNNDILVDVGAAEGNLPLSVIERVKKAYLFETDEAWIEALQATFAPWKEKVEIVNKFVSNRDEGKFVSLDKFFAHKEAFTFLKVDAEGAESDILNGAETVLDSVPALKIALCCYHKPNDDKIFHEFLSKRGFSISFANGYMIFRENFVPPYLRRGVLRAERK